VIDTGTGTVSLRATFHNPHGLLHSGGAGNVLIPTQYDNCITIPKSATFEIQDQIYVYKNVDGIAQSTRIEVSPLSDDQEYIVTAGLTNGDMIVAEGVGFIRDGQGITTQN
jgi:membrane fusion protein (multidrug efflux system)